MNNHFSATPDFSDKILSWYDAHARSLPWRSTGSHTPDAYHVWLSEIMLQQTTVATVGPYFQKFLSLWPGVGDLAAAPLDDVLTAWAGLGYYARARNLHKCAIAVSQDHGGVFPVSEDILRSLPGIGDYTAAAITAIAHGNPAVVVDGNIERIISRIFKVEEELPKGRKLIRELAGRVSPQARPGDYAQALMDIGATVCTPRKPLCGQCPVSSACAARDAGDAVSYPRKAPKKVKPTRSAAVFWIEKPSGEVLMRRRAESGLLGGMMEFPSTPWLVEAGSADHHTALLDELGLSGASLAPQKRSAIKHTFTHFHLYLHPVVLQLSSQDQVLSNDVRWILRAEFDQFALPTLMKKVATAVDTAQADLL